MSIQKNERLKNKIIEYIYDAILSDRYQKAEQIKEVPLSDTLNVSRAPVREALHELVSLGILEQIERRGVFVKNITNNDIFNTYESKGVIEGYLATSFALHATQKDMEKLDKFVLEMSNNSNNEKTVARIGGKFHQFCIKYANNSFLLDSLEKLNKKSQLLFSRNWSKLYTVDEIKKRHQKIVNVLKKRDTKEIEECIKEHYFETGAKIVMLNNKKG